MKELSLILIIWSVCAAISAGGVWNDGFEGDAPESMELVADMVPTDFFTEDGMLIVDVEIPAYTYVRITGSNNWSNYTLYIRTQILEEYGDLVSAGVMVCENTYPTNFYLFLIADRWSQEWPGIPPEGSGAFAVPGVKGVAHPAGVSVFKPEIGRWYRLQSAVEPGHAEFYLDDELVAQFDYPELRSGGVGVVVSNARVAFDDLIVIGDTIPDGGPGGAVFPVDNNRIATIWGFIKSRL